MKEPSSLTDPVHIPTLNITHLAEQPYCFVLTGTSTESLDEGRNINLMDIQLEPVPLIKGYDITAILDSVDTEEEYTSATATSAPDNTDAATTSFTPWWEDLVPCPTKQARAGEEVPSQATAVASAGWWDD